MLNYSDELNAIREELTVRRYRWALADAKREVAENLRLLRLAKSALTMSFVEFADGLGVSDRLTLLSASVKRAYSRAAELVGDSMTSDEKDLYDGETAYVQKGIAKGLWPFGAQERAKISRKEFRALLRTGLAERGLGEFEPWQLPDEWRYRLKVGSWSVETYIDTGGSFRQIGFTHGITGPDGTPLFQHLAGAICVGSNDWDMVADKDLAHVVDDIVVITRHFIDSMPKLLAGLEPPVSE